MNKKLKKKKLSIFTVLIIMLSMLLNFPMQASALTGGPIGRALTTFTPFTPQGLVYFHSPNAVVVDSNGNMYVAEQITTAYKNLIQVALMLRSGVVMDLAMGSLNTLLEWQ